MQTDFINAAKANDLDRLDYLMDIEELQIPLLNKRWDFSGGTTARLLACMDAARHNHPEALSLIFKRGCMINIDIIIELFQGKRKDCIDALLAQGWDVSMPLGHVGDPLILSLRDLDMVQFLLSRGADPNRGYYMDTWTALEIAAARKSISVIEALLVAGAKLKKSHALARAAGNGNIDVVAYLLDRGAAIDEVGDDPFIFDNDLSPEFNAKNALCTAAFRGQPAAVEFLLARGADPSVKSRHGDSAWELAEMKGNQACVDILNRYK
ncbi:ankyrin [Aspergillus cavernicola]|uniref:Ankyrin n=1 Tax=Aspergillus cavernicola TaxID=176166 RepID=A0ABR4J1F7_9EURO